MELTVRSNTMEIDLNQEPFDQAHRSVMRLDSILNELESTHGHIEERIRHLEAVTARARQRQSWSNGQTPLEITNVTARLEAADSQDEDSAVHEVADFICEEGTIRSGKSGKRDSTFLIAKALEIDIDKTGRNAGGFFDCNICLDVAKDPILTCCGHLFCWACFYQLSYAYSNAKECPVCRGEVTDSGITPIYGNGNVAISPSCRSDEKPNKIPPRPRAQRIESIRQQLVNQQSIPIPIEERFQRFSNMIDAMRERVRSEAPQDAAQRNNSWSNSQSPTLLNFDAENNHQIHTSHFSSLLMQGAASFSSLSALSSALDSAERVAEDLASYIHSHHNGRRNYQSRLGVNGEPLSSTANGQQSEDDAIEIYLDDLPFQSSTFSNTGEAELISSEIQNTGISAELNAAMYPNSSTYSVRGDLSRGSDAGDGVSRASRRRRLN